MPMKNPPHPGGLIGTEIVQALGLNVTQAARILKVRRATLSGLLHGKATLTPEMALRIEKAFGPDMNHLLRMQLAYDVAKVRQHSRKIAVKRYVPAQERKGNPMPTRPLCQLRNSAKHSK
jgi:addiction module HigA family antidote